MATIATEKKIRGGSFLIEDRTPGEVFIPEEFTDEQRQIGQTTEEFIAGEVVPRAEELEHKKEGLMPELLRKAAEIGLLGADVPEAYGGLTSCYCLSEAEAGSDALAAKARADLTPDGKHYVLNGQKMWITNGGFADVFIVFAKVGGEKFSCFIVEKATPGFSIGPEEKKMGIKGSSTVPIFFDNAKIPAENLLHEVGRGHIVAFNILNVGRFKLAAYCTGGCKNSLAGAVKYALERKAFGKAIAEFGLIQHKLGEMAIATYAAESMIYRTAGMIDSALHGVNLSAADAPQHAMKALEEFAVECSINKVYASEAVDYCVDEFVQILGGYGYHQDYPAERAYRDARINRIFEGTNEINRLLITAQLFKRAMKGELPLMAAAKKVADELMSAAPAAAPAAGDGRAARHARRA